MIVVSAGLPRSGTSWLFNLVNDLLVAAGHDDGRAVRDDFRLAWLLRDVNCELDPLTLGRLAPLLVPHLRGRTFAVKSHSRPSRTIDALLRLGVCRVTYIDRDPRDAAVSAFREGAAARRRGAVQAPFARLLTMEDAVASTRSRVSGHRPWRRRRDVFHTSYEDLVADPAGVLTRIAGHLGIKAAPPVVAGIAQRYGADRVSVPDAARIHCVRHEDREPLSPDQRRLCDEGLGQCAREMGYGDWPVA